MSLSPVSRQRAAGAGVVGTKHHFATVGRLTVTTRTGVLTHERTPTNFSWQSVTGCIEMPPPLQAYFVSGGGTTIVPAQPFGLPAVFRGLMALRIPPSPGCRGRSTMMPPDTFSDSVLDSLRM